MGCWRMTYCQASFAARMAAASGSPRCWRRRRCCCRPGPRRCRWPAIGRQPTSRASAARSDRIRRSLFRTRRSARKPLWDTIWLNSNQQGAGHSGDIKISIHFNILQYFSPAPRARLFCPAARIAVCLAQNAPWHDCLAGMPPILEGSLQTVPILLAGMWIRLSDDLAF